MTGGDGVKSLGSCSVLTERRCGDAEVNDTATGLNPFHQEEDTAHIRDLVLRRMSEAFNATNSN